MSKLCGTLPLNDKLVSDLAIAIRDFAMRPQHWSTYGSLPSEEELEGFLKSFLAQRNEDSAKEIHAAFDSVTSRMKNGKE